MTQVPGRVFNGKRYKYAYSVRIKKDANWYATDKRKHGYLARIVKEPSDGRMYYTIYTHKK